MSAPKIIIQIAITGAQIFGKALAAAGRQAVINARHRPQGLSNDSAAGVGHATSGSPTDRLTREHRMTLDEAYLILNYKKGDPVETILQNYEHLFKANSPQPPPAAPATGKQPVRYHSHYLQSKIVRARERIEAETKAAESEPEAETPKSTEEPSRPTDPPSQPPPSNPT